MTLNLLKARMATKPLRFFAPLGALASVLAVSLFVLPVFAETNPTLTTDKPDYHPGEVVHISGMNLPPGEYAMPVKRPSGDIVVIDPETHESTDGWEHATADENGNLTYDYQLNGVLGTYEARAYPAPWSGDWNEAPVASITFQDAAAADIDQCRNGTFASPVQCTGAAWVNGNANATQAHFLEGDSQAYRVKLTDIDTGNWTYRITYDSTESGGEHGIDYLTSFDRTETTADPCSGFTFTVVTCNANTPQGSLPIPADPRVTAGPDATPATADDITQAAGNIELFGNATLTSVGAPTLTSGTYTTSPGPGYVGATQTSVEVSFTVAANNQNLVIAWGGHISKRTDWAPEPSAATISGSPYHMRNGGLRLNGNCESCGNQDRQLAAGAIVSPASVKIVKQATPEGATSFPFTSSLDGPFSLVDDGTSANTVTFSNITTFGNRTYTENTPAGWSLTDITCVDSRSGSGTNASSDSGATATAAVDEGEDVVCTFTNEEQSSITIEKDTVPNALQDFAYTTGGTGLSNFSLDDDASVGGGDNTLLNTKTFTNPATGDKYIRETPGVAGYSLGSITCTGDTTGVVIGRGGTTAATFTDGGSAGFEHGDDTVKIPVDAGDQVSCKFTNNKDATVQVVKDAVPNDAQDFDFDGSGGGISADFDLDDDSDGTLQNSVTFTIDSSEGFDDKTITENTPGGWSIGSIDCTGAGDNEFSETSNSATVGVDPGETIVCTFVNNKDAKLTVVKNATPDSSQAFTINHTGTGMPGSPFSLVDDGAGPGDADDEVTFQSGEFGVKTLSESVPNGWSLASATCVGGTDTDGGDGISVTIQPGDNVTCTFTNNQNATVTVVKDARPDDAQDFDFDGSGGGVSTDFDLDDDADGTLSNEVTFTIGTADGFNDKTITETTPGGWSIGDIDCTGAGTGEFSETANSATVGVDPGETIVCTFVNNKDATVKVVKDARPDDAQDFDFDGSGGGVSTDFDLDDDADNTLSNEVTFTIDSVDGFDNKTVLENTPGGWSIGDIDCTGAGQGEFTEGASSATVGVDPGETIVCTFVNNKDATVKVVKDARPDDAQDFDFDGSGGGISTDFDLDDDADGTLSNETTFTVDSADGFDDKTVLENTPGGWSIGDIDCTGAGQGEFSETSNSATVGVDPGETIICTFVNNKDATVKVVKDARPDDAQDFDFDGSGGGISTDFDLDDDADGTLSNETTFTIDSADGFDDKTVTENTPGGWSIGDIDCTGAGQGEFTEGSNSATVGVDPGETIVCTFVNNKDATVKVVKDARPDSDQDFDFTGSGGGINANFQLDDDGDGTLPNETTFTIDTADGFDDKTITETPLPSGWSIGDIDCTGAGTGEFSETSNSATVGVDPGETIVCTFVNNKDATVKVVKDARPDSAQDFDFDGSGGGISTDFDLDDDADNTLSNETTFTIDTADGYNDKTITENTPGGWSIGDIDCTGAGQGEFSETANSATVGVDPGETIVCTFVNNKDATVKVVKDARPDDAQDFDFDGSGGGVSTDFDLDDDADNTLSNEVTFTIDSADGFDNKTVLENTPGGWSIGDIDCTGAGTGEFSETANSATVGVDPGETIVCTFVNNKDATVKVVKDARPDDAQDFDFDGSGGGVSTDFDLDDDGDGTLSNETTFTIDSADGFDNKTVLENTPGGWSIGDIDCTGAGQGEYSETANSATVGVDPGETIVCTFVNNKDATVKVVKDATPEDGTDFDFTGSGGGVDASFKLDDDSDGTLPNERTFTIDTADGFNDKTITETPLPSGWSIGDIECTGAGQGEFSETSDSAMVGVDPGETIVCTFENNKDATVKVVKDASPEDGTDFDFTGSGGGVDASFKLDDDQDGTLPNERTFTIDSADGFNDKTITETPLPNGWSIGDIDCTGAGQGEFSETANSATVGVDPGETIVCTFKNNKDATVKVVKDARPDDAQDFDFDGSGGGIAADFDLDDDGDGTLSNETTFTIDSADGFDDKTVTENTPGGWSIGDIDCTGAGANEFSETSNSATVGVDPGETIVCTFVNNKDATVKVVKDATPEDGTDFDFTGSGGGIDTGFQLDDDQDGTLPNERTFTIDTADGFNDKTITETPLPAGWSIGDIDCTGAGANEFSETSNSATVGVDPGEAIVCTFKNNKDAKLKVVKDATPDSSQAFTINHTGTGMPANPFSLVDDGAGPGDPDDEVTFQSGEFGVKTLTEAVPNGWSLESATCTGATDTDTGDGISVDIQPGADVVCTFKNNQNATVKVVKDASPEDGTDFDFTGSGGGIDANFKLDDDSDGTLPNERTFTIDTADGFNDKTIAETPLPNGWSIGDIDCTGAGQGEFSKTADSATVGVDPGETIVCTFKNNKDATVKVVKDASPEDGTDFDFTGSGGGVDASFKLDDDSDGTLPNERTFTIDSGDGFNDKTITETPLPSGWSIGDIDCTGAGQGEFSETSNSATVGVDPGETIVCTFKNNKDAKLKVVKEATPESSQAFTINHTGSGMPANPFSLVDDGAGPGDPDDEVTFQSGEFGVKTLTEQVPDTWALESATCTGATDTDAGAAISVDIQPGADVVCTFKNEKQAKLTVVKEATPASSQAFTINSGGAGLPASFQLTDDNGGPGDADQEFTFGPGQFGTKTLAEQVPNGWSLASATCTGKTDTDAGAGISIDLQAGDEATCTFKNEEHASITIEKDAIPNALDDFPYATGGLSPANFQLDDDAGVPGGDNTLQNTHAFTGLTTFGDRYVRETPTNYDITNITCTGDTAGVVYGRGGTTAGTFTSGPTDGFEAGDDAVKIPLDAGDDVHCKFVNNRHMGTLRVVKQVINDNGGTLGPDAFSLHVKQNGTDVASSPQPGSASGTVYTLPTGSYSVSEDAPPSGYQQVGFSGDCDSSGAVTVVQGQERTCTITNDDIPPTPETTPPPETIEVLGVQKKKKDTRRPNIGVGGVRDQCVSRDFAASIRVSDASRVRAVTVKLDGRVIKRAKTKRFKVRIPANRLKKGRHRLTITARDSAGNRRTVSRTFSRCAPPALPNFTG